ncbi:MAG: chaperone modulator CbpM [Bacteriovorax sp.]|nr:chaperone modulator CbpM [Bacteriovorax sp.]
MNSISNMNINDAASIYGINIEHINYFINENWIFPNDPTNTLLDEEDISRIQLIDELIFNLGVNEQGISIILHLLDQLNHLRQEIIKNSKKC